MISWSTRDAVDNSVRVQWGWSEEDGWCIRAYRPANTGKDLADEEWEDDPYLEERGITALNVVRIAYEQGVTIPEENL